MSEARGNNKVVLEFDVTKLPLESDIDRESWCDAVFGALAEGDCLSLPDGVRLCDTASDFLNPFVYCTVCHEVYKHNDCKRRGHCQQ